MFSTATEALGSGGVGEHHLPALTLAHGRGGPRGSPFGQHPPHRRSSNRDEAALGFAPHAGQVGESLLIGTQGAVATSTASTSSTVHELLAGPWVRPTRWRTGEPASTLRGQQARTGVDSRGPSISRRARDLGDVGIEGGPITR